MKCPNCAGEIPALSLHCVYCGHEVSNDSRREQSVDHIKELQQKLIEADNSVSAKDKMLYGEMRVWNNKANIIMAFTLPTTKQDLLNFFLFAYGNYEGSKGGIRIGGNPINKAWLGKAKQAYGQLKVYGAGDAIVSNTLKQYSSLETTNAETKKGCLPFLVMIFCLSISAFLMTSCSSLDLKDNEEMRDFLCDRTFYMNGDLFFYDDGTIRIKSDIPSDPTKTYTGTYELGACESCDNPKIALRKINIVIDNNGHLIGGYYSNGWNTTYQKHMQGWIRKEQGKWTISFPNYGSTGMSVELGTGNMKSSSKSWTRELKKVGDNDDLRENLFKTKREFPQQPPPPQPTMQKEKAIAPLDSNTADDPINELVLCQPTGPNVNVRSGPGKQFDVLFQLNPGDFFEILESGKYDNTFGKQGYWKRIQFDDKKGWMFDAFMTCD